MGDAELLHLDGSYGEGGGQILRTALSLSATLGRPVRLERIRARRDPSGLRPQHLTAVRALAAICGAALVGDTLGSQTLSFSPGGPTQAGEYVFDVAEAAQGGSAGAVTLLFQALLLPLALADGPSRLTLRGGTHTRWSPPYHHLTDVYLPTLQPVGLHADLALGHWGWYPRGGGEMTADIAPVTGGRAGLGSLAVAERGRLLGVEGLSASSRLPTHVMERQRDQAIQRLRSRHIKAEIATYDAPSPGPGSMLWLLARYENCRAGFTGYGRLRYPAEKVADDAFEAFDAHRMSRAALDPHLADQLVLPLALAPGRSTYTTSEVSAHLTTVCWVVGQILGRNVSVEGAPGQPGTVSIGA